MTMQYYPRIFDVADIDRAKRIILTNEGPGADTETRWTRETPYVMELIRNAFSLRPGMLVLDYGCGVGRLAKAMIEASGCTVIGVDISANMRKLAGDYVASDRFITVSPDQFDVMVGAGLRVHAAISVWVLQHCLVPADDIERIRGSLITGGHCFVLNMPKRAIPAVRDKATENGRFLWATDNIDVGELLHAAFDVESDGIPDASRTPNMATSGAFWMNLRRRQD